MRERHFGQDLFVTKKRITPAYAGKTIFPKEYEYLFEDHPRVCGKDPVWGSYTLTSAGSPPRMRERPKLYQIHPPHSGITPAYAGKTSPITVLF